MIYSKNLSFSFYVLIVSDKSENFKGKLDKNDAKETNIIEKNLESTEKIVAKESKFDRTVKWSTLIANSAVILLFIGSLLFYFIKPEEFLNLFRTKVFITVDNKTVNVSISDSISIKDAVQVCVTRAATNVTTCY